MDNKEDKQGFHISDRRFWVDTPGTGEEAAIPEKKYPSYVEELKARTELAERKLKERVQQLESENDSYRQRLGREMERRLEQEKLEILREFLEVSDNFERALDVAQLQAAKEAGCGDLLEGIQLNLELLLSKLRARGVEPLEALHQPFDPHQMEAVGTVPVKEPELDQKVIEVVQKGYCYKDQLLRPARVRFGQYLRPEAGGRKPEHQT